MNYLKQSIIYIMLISFLFYIITNYFPIFGFSIESEYANELVICFFVGIVSWFFNFLLGGILGFLTKPLTIITFGVFSLIVNFMLLYVIEQSIAYLDVGVKFNLGNIIQTFELSCIMGLINVLIKKNK